MSSYTKLISALGAQGAHNDDSCTHCCRWLKQASIPALPPPPVFAEEFGSTAAAVAATETETETDVQLSIVHTPQQVSFLATHLTVIR